jgi:predicted ATPase/DNA-binding SARP family transcriptional activator
VEFRLLGRLEVQADGTDLTPARPKQRALLTLLLLRAGEVVAIDDLVEALWSGRPPPSAQTALHGHISALRKRLGVERIETHPPGYRLVLADGDVLDTHRFERLVDSARAEGPPARSEKLREALGLFRGEALSDVRDEGIAAAEAARLEELRLAVVEDRVEADLALGRHAEVVPELERLVADNPLRERLRAQLMLALYGAGRQADALQSFQDARAILVEELGIDPSPALQRLERQILNHDPELTPAKRRVTTRVDLPVPSSSLIGRDREVREVTGLLGRSDVRVVTLTGTGGTGKTRLAVEVAYNLVDRFADGVVFVGLASLQDPDLVLTTAAQALGETPESDLGRQLRSRELLLVFDNFEHVLDAAPSLADITATAPGVKLLVTSRAPLRLSAERVYPVSPLETPEDGEVFELLVRRASVALFEARAQAVRPDFAVTPANASSVADLCTGLDGLPLAIELAATRIGALPPAALRQRLDHRLKLLVGGARDAPERHRTLRATIDWSYRLLEPAEQRLFVRLAAFSGGCTIEAAARVCEDGDVVDGLASLTDKGLLRPEGTDEEPRFSMLETIREYALERLEASGEAAAVRTRHARYFLGFAEEAEPHLIGPGSHVAWLDRLEAEHANLRAAIDWFEGSGAGECVLRLSAALWQFWGLNGHIREGRARLERALGADERPTAARAKALSRAADMALDSGDVATAGERAREALDLHRMLGDVWGAAFSRLMVAFATGHEGDWAGAQQLCSESTRQFRELGDEHYALRATRGLALSHYEGGDIERARMLYEEIITAAREANDPFAEGAALWDLAGIAADEGRLEDAVPLVEESCGIFRDLGDRRTIAAVCRCAQILALAGRPELATHALASSAAPFGEISEMPAHLAETNRRTLAVVRPQLDDAAFADAWEQGRTMTAGEAVALALDSLAAAGGSLESRP